MSEYLEVHLGREDGTTQSESNMHTSRFVEVVHLVGDDGLEQIVRDALQLDQNKVSKVPVDAPIAMRSPAELDALDGIERGPDTGGCYRSGRRVVR